MYVAPERLDKGLVIVLTGIHGRLWLSESICQGLADGGVDQAIEIYDWTYHGHLLPLYNLGAVERNHNMARQIAAHVRAYQKDYPGRPVTVVGYSGGGPLAVWTAESLPKGAQVDGIVLLSTPLIPKYDLRPALSTSRKGIVSFYSPNDRVYLALGTLIFGTMDKQHCISAGNVGFVDPRKSHAAGSATQPAPGLSGDKVYDKLYQVPWKPQMAKYGYDGTHLTIGAKDFIVAYVAPLVKARQWDAHFVAQLPEVSPTSSLTTSAPTVSRASMP
jgi:pimeloyl-ACP methyl ester carboxylesterase